MLGLLAKRCWVICLKKLFLILKMKSSITTMMPMHNISVCPKTRSAFKSYRNTERAQPTAFHTIHLNFGHTCSSCGIFQFNTFIPLWRYLGVTQSSAFALSHHTTNCFTLWVNLQTLHSSQTQTYFCSFLTWWSLWSWAQLKKHCKYKGWDEDKGPRQEAEVRYYHKSYRYRHTSVWRYPTTSSPQLFLIWLFS